MNGIRIFPVQTKNDWQIFLSFPWKIYRDDPNWVAPLFPERRRFLDPKRGPFFKHGRAEFFIAWRGKEPVGTVCAAEDVEMNQARHLKDCVFGFFECVNDPIVATAIFDHLRDWAHLNGLTALYGPYNLDYEDGYGVQIEGWDRPPAMFCGHTPPYYQAFFENYGFKPARGDNLAFGMTLESGEMLDSLHKMAERVAQRTRFTIRPADFSQWDREIDLVYPMINAALAHLPDHRPWPREELVNLFRPFRQIADPELILFAMDGDRTIGFFPGIPDLNRVFRQLDGMRYPWDYLRLWFLMRAKNPDLTIKSILLYPEYWGSGVAVLLFSEMAQRAVLKGYRWIDLSLTSADNPRTPQLAERFGAKIYRRYRVYRLPL